MYSSNNLKIYVYCSILNHQKIAGKEKDIYSNNQWRLHGFNNQRLVCLEENFNIDEALWKRIFQRFERGFFKGYLFSEMKQQREKFGYRWSSRLFDGGNKISAKFDKNQFWKGFNLSFWFWLRSVNSHWSSK